MSMAATHVPQKKETTYNKIIVFDRNILRIIYGPVFVDCEQKWKNKSNKELKNFYTNVEFADGSILAWAVIHGEQMVLLLRC